MLPPASLSSPALMSLALDFVPLGVDLPPPASLLRTPALAPDFVPPLLLATRPPLPLAGLASPSSSPQAVRVQAKTSASTHRSPQRRIDTPPRLSRVTSSQSCAWVSTRTSHALERSRG